MEAEAIREVRDLTLDSGIAKLEMFDLKDGKQHIRLGNTLHTFEYARPGHLEFNTLAALVDFIKSPFDSQYKDKCPYVLVKGPTQVIYTSVMNESYCGRDALASVAPILPKAPQPDTWLTPEQFIIYIQTGFVFDVADWAAVAQCCGNIKIENSESLSDDGISQQVNVQAGLSLAKTIKLPNPVQLAPYRTFPEIEQPISSFILRATSGRDGVSLKLVEADGGAWRLEAVKRIKAWLDDALKEQVEAKSIVVLA